MIETKTGLQIHDELEKSLIGSGVRWVRVDKLKDFIESNQRIGIHAEIIIDRLLEEFSDGDKQ